MKAPLLRISARCAEYTTVGATVVLSVVGENAVLIAQAPFYYPVSPCPWPRAEVHVPAATAVWAVHARRSRAQAERAGRCVVRGFLAESGNRFHRR